MNSGHACVHILYIFLRKAFLCMFSIVNKELNICINPPSFLIAIKESFYTGCIKKKVIELQRAIVRESLGV